MLPALLPPLRDEREDDEPKPAREVQVVRREGGYNFSDHYSDRGGWEDQAIRSGPKLHPLP